MKAQPGQDAEEAAARRSARVLALGILLLCLGMVLVLAGIVIGSLFLPGVIVIAIGVLALMLASALPLLPAPGR